MDIALNQIIIENFKSYGEMQRINIADLTILMGANSSGKSTALQALLMLKQTMECNSPDIDLLLSGKYVTLGNFDDVVNDSKKTNISIGIGFCSINPSEDYCETYVNEIIWKFTKDDTKNQKIKLAEIELNIDGNSVILKRGNNGKYNIFIDGKNIQMGAYINNLIVSKSYILYDSRFNDIFVEFLNEVTMCIKNSKKISKFEKDKMCALYGVANFEFLFFKENPSINNIDISSETKKSVDTLLNLIDDYSEYQFADYRSFDRSIPRNILEKIISIPLEQNGKYMELDIILEKYSKKLEQERRIELENTKIMISPNMGFWEDEYSKDEKSPFEIYQFVLKLYKSVLKDGFKNIFYVGPLREKPHGLYNPGFEAIPKYVGPTGAYFASVLLNENKISNYVLPSGKIEGMELTEALDEWATHLNIASEINVEQSNSFGFSVSISNIQRKKADIMNVGIGTSQVLPVLITGLLSEEGETLIFEQPELHLHPYSQSRLADFFVALANNKRHIIVESHSEYLVLRLRYHLVAGKLNNDKIKLNFFQNKNGTKIEEGVLNGYGNLEYPSDFEDETQNLLDDLLHAAMKKSEI